MTIETQSVDNSPQHKHTIDVNTLKDSLRSWGDRVESQNEDKKEQNEKIEAVVHELATANLPIAEIEAILNTLPLDKRFLIEKMILDEQRHQISEMSQEKYKQYLQTQFPSGVPSNVSEMALSMVADTSEMYKLTQQEIEKTTAGENPSEIAKKELKTDQREAVVLTQRSEQATQQLSRQLSQVSKQQIV